MLESFCSRLCFGGRLNHVVIHVMKYILFASLFAVASCATDSKNWEMSDPNDGATIAGDISDMRYYSSDSLGKERGVMTEREMRELTRKKEDKKARFSGELSVGVGKRF